MLNTRLMPEGSETKAIELCSVAAQIATDGMWDWRIDTDEVYFDQQFHTVAGYEPNEFPANIEAWIARVHPEDLPGFREKIAACRKVKKDVYEAQCRFRTRNDVWIWIHARGKIVKRSPDGCPLRMIGVINDITEKKINETKNREAEAVWRLSSEKRYRMVVENAHEGIIIAQNGRLRYANPSTERMLGYTRKELTRAPFKDLIHEDDRAMVVDRHQRRLHGEPVPEYYSFRARHKSGKELWLEINTVLTQWGGAPAIQAFMRDITRTKLMEKQLIQSQKMQAIGTLAGGIAHDFNNILSAMMGYTELCLTESGKGSPLAPRLKRVLQAGSRARDLVKQILSFSRQRDDIEKPIEIGPIIDEAMTLLRPSIPANIAIDLRLEKEAGIVQANPSRIHQIVMNLCVNAAHAMKTGDGRLSIRLANLELAPEDTERFLDVAPGPYVKVSVSDTGHGMAPAVVKRIFDPYFTTKPLGEGTGLGLSVVHGIVTSLGGVINVYSEPDHGTTFNLYLPQVRNDLNAEPGGQAEFPGGSETILLVDDEQFVLDMTAEMLRGLGYAVTTRISSVEALQAFAATPQRFDLVVTDHTMPQLSGLELSRKIRELRPDQLIVLCSGFSPGLTESSCMAYGIRALLNKPILKGEMATAIRRVLDEKTAE